MDLIAHQSQQSCDRQTDGQNYDFQEKCAFFLVADWACMQLEAVKLLQVLQQQCSLFKNCHEPVQHNIGRACYQITKIFYLHNVIEN